MSVIKETNSYFYNSVARAREISKEKEERNNKQDEEGELSKQKMHEKKRNRRKQRDQMNDLAMYE